MINLTKLANYLFIIDADPVRGRRRWTQLLIGAVFVNNHWWLIVSDRDSPVSKPGAAGFDKDGHRAVFIQCFFNGGRYWGVVWDGFVLCHFNYLFAFVVFTGNALRDNRSSVGAAIYYARLEFAYLRSDITRIRIGGRIFEAVLCQVIQRKSR